MNLYNQIELKNNIKDYNYLKENSFYIKDFNRGNIQYKEFSHLMKEKYKERTSDKINSVIDNMDLISSVLDILK